MNKNFKLPGGFTEYVETSIAEGVYIGKEIYIKQVIYNNPATIVFWSDNTKTVAKCVQEAYDKEKGLLICIMKKLYGGTKLNNLLKFWAQDESNIIDLSAVRAKQRKLDKKINEDK